MGVPTRFIPFDSFTDYTPTIPKLYWNVRSQEQRILELFKLVDKVIAYAEHVGEDIDSLIEMVNDLNEELETTLAEVQEELDKTKEEIEQMLEGFYDRMLARFLNWLDENMPAIIGKSAQMVFFGLTLDGHFVTYIPTGYAWDDIVFDTGMDYSLDTYGRLILRMDVDQTYNVDQTHETVRP